MFNLVVLTGRLTSDPELKKTQSDVPFTNFSIAVQRAYRSGEEPITDFINIAAWRQKAEFITKYFKKGNMIGIEGSIQTRKYQDKDGNNRTAFKVVANNAQFVESKKSDNNTNVNVNADPLPEFEQKLNAVNNSDEFTEVNGVDDDLPF